ncbi:unnamed protein product [Auanema sp. JU1783]|nr:unnamed protein product [Auanema sp. JU1783]
MDAPSSPKGNKSVFSTPAKGSSTELNPNESIISPRTMRDKGTPRKPTKKPFEHFEPNCSIIEADEEEEKKNGKKESMFETPRKPSSLLLSQLSQNQAVVTENFLSCKLNQQTRVVRTEPKGRTYYTTVPMISSFSPKSDTQNLLSNKSEVKSLIQEETSKEKTRMEQRLLAEIELNRRGIQELRERIMRDKRDACTCVNESFAYRYSDDDVLSDSSREYAQNHPWLNFLFSSIQYLLMIYFAHIVTEPFFENGSYKNFYVKLYGIRQYVREIVSSIFDM